jgi:hypothetical protein
MIDSPSSSSPNQPQQTEVRRRSSSNSEQTPLAMSYDPSIGKFEFPFSIKIFIL